MAGATSVWGFWRREDEGAVSVDGSVLGVSFAVSFAAWASLGDGVGPVLGPVLIWMVV